MTERVVGEGATTKRDHSWGAEIIGEELFIVFARHARVALLDFAEQTFFRGEDGAASVDVNGSTLEDDACVAVQRTDFLRVGGIGHQCADFFVVTPVGIFRPGVEAEVEGEEAGRGSMWGQPPKLALSGAEGPVWPGEARRLSCDEDAAGIAKPGSIGGLAVEADIFRKSICPVEEFARLAFCRGVVDD